jgi:PTH1 family peptidyl-tRNA hydrolase
MALLTGLAPQKGLNPQYLVVGLGNPGPAYARTRHNAGFRVVERLAESFGIPLVQTRAEAVFGAGRIRGLPVVLAKPIAFMNRSGPPVRELIDFFEISSEQIIVIHDDLDLVLGRLKIKEKGGHGGHKGVWSLMDAVGGGNFTRVRIGIGRSRLPGGLQPDTVAYVLGRFSGEEETILEPVLARACEAVVTILCHGTREAMNRFNGMRV